jgi:hypothetical protein
MYKHFDYALILKEITLISKVSLREVILDTRIFFRAAS